MSDTADPADTDADKKPRAKLGSRNSPFNFGPTFLEPTPGAIVFHLDLSDPDGKGRIAKLEPVFPCHGDEMQGTKLNHRPGDKYATIYNDEEGRQYNAIFHAHHLSLAGQHPPGLLLATKINFIVGVRTYAYGTLELATLGWYWRRGLTIPDRQQFGMEIECGWPSKEPVRLYLRGEWGRAL